MTALFEDHQKTMPIKRMVLGKTGLEINRLGLGGIPIQRVGEKQAVETVLHAIEKGIDFIDTSRAYTTSERRIGLALRQTNKRVVLSSKSLNRTAEGIEKDLEISRKELQRDFIDLYKCHFVQTGDEYRQVVSSGGALEGLLKAKEDGRIGHTGISCHCLDLLDRVLDDGLFDTIMVCFSFLEPAAREKIIPKALEKNVGIIAMKPFSGGVIENARLSLKYALSQPEVLILAGVEHKDLFDENWEVFQGSHRLDETERQEIKEIQKRHAQNFCRRCDYCQPCTEGIAIQAVLGLPSQVKRMGKDILVKGRRVDIIQRARNCTQCGECMTRCPYELPIPDLIRENLKWVDDQLA